MGAATKQGAPRGSLPKLWISSREVASMLEVPQKFEVKLGGNVYIDTPRLIVSKGAPLLQLRRNASGGILEMDLDVFDESGRRTAVFRNGNLARADSGAYIVTARHDEYRVTERCSGRAVVNVKRRLASADVHVWVQMYTPRGFLFVATPTKMNFKDGVQATGAVIRDGQNGIVID